jgi:putative two-component system response regulator
MIDYGFLGTRIKKIAPPVVNSSMTAQAGKVLVIDDHPFSRLAAVDLLSLDGYAVSETDGSIDIIPEVLNANPDLILLDVMIPYQYGFELCKQIKQDRRTCSIPIIFMTVSDDRQWRLQSYEVGGDDFLVKPLDRFELSNKVSTLIQHKRLNESLAQTNQVLLSLASAIQSRYVDSPSSWLKLEQLAQSFGKYLNLSSAEITDLIYAARFHDIGTIAIPDAVLLKKGNLTEEERELIKQHVLIGEQICQPMRNWQGILPIIRHHHERWDGSGYPDGLTGEQIPRLAQVFQILDIYDALTSERPYKQAFTSTQALEILAEEAAKGWRNPQLVEQFIAFIRKQARGKRGQ